MSKIEEGKKDMFRLLHSEKQINKMEKCSHRYPDGKSSMQEGFMMSNCVICGWDDF